jgi:hypothetical protein
MHRKKTSMPMKPGAMSPAQAKTSAMTPTTRTATDRRATSTTNGMSNSGIRNGLTRAATAAAPRNEATTFASATTT